MLYPHITLCTCNCTLNFYIKRTQTVHMYICTPVGKMYSTGVIIAILIGGLIATAASSNIDVLCYLQKLEDKLDTLHDKLDTLQNQCCNGTGNGGDKPKRTRDPSTIPDTPIKTFTGFNKPWNIFITDANIAYLPEYGSRKLRTLDTDGNTLNVISSPGHPTSISVHGGEVYVTDMKNNIIRRYTRDLVAVSSKDINSPRPVALAVDSDGIIYVSEYFHGKVNVYKDDGTKTGQIDFNIPVSTKYIPNIRFDSNQVLFGSSHYESSIYSYTKGGVLVNKFTLSGSNYVTNTNGPFVDDIGNIYVADSSNGMIHIMDSSGTVIKSFQSAAEHPSDVAMGPDGIIWIVDYIHGNIYLY